MGYKRFLRINVALHYIDVIGITFWLVTPFVDQLNRTFRQYPESSNISFILFELRSGKQDSSKITLLDFMVKVTH